MPINVLAQSGGGGGYVQYIVYLIIGITVLRTIFSGDPKKKKSKNQRARNRAAADTSSGRRPTLDEVTQRKRQQLQELARQQRGGNQASAPGNSSAGADPGNMTMAERIARARAKQQYEQRAAQGGQGQPAPAQTPRAQPAPQAPARSGASAQELRAESLRKKLETRRRQQQQALARRQNKIQQAKSRRQSPSSRPAPRRPAPVPHGIGGQPEHEEVHRMVTNLEDTPSTSSGAPRHQSGIGAAAPAVSGRKRARAGLNFAKLSTADLRRAFILKEVLDKPVAERDPLADVNG